MSYLFKSFLLPKIQWIFIYSWDIVPTLGMQLERIVEDIRNEKFWKIFVNLYFWYYCSTFVQFLLF